jgi:hypothetical protein
MNTLVHPVNQDPRIRLYNQIQPGLFMGGTLKEDLCQGEAGRNPLRNHLPFDAIATMYSWAKPAYWGIQEMRYGFLDASIVDMDKDRLGEIVGWAHKHWKKGDRVLIRCQAGLNRSGLVTALVLMLAGVSADDAISCIRRYRSPDALFNTEYVSWLLSEGESFIGALKNRALQEFLESVDLAVDPHAYVADRVG